MFGITDLTTYILGTIFIVLLPGPNSMYVLSVAAQRGLRAGFAGAAGVFVGDFILMTLAATGAAGAPETGSRFRIACAPANSDKAANCSSDKPKAYCSAARPARQRVRTP